MKSVQGEQHVHSHAFSYIYHYYKHLFWKKFFADIIYMGYATKINFPFSQY